MAVPVVPPTEPLGTALLSIRADHNRGGSQFRLATVFAVCHPANTLTYSKCAGS